MAAAFGENAASANDIVDFLRNFQNSRIDPQRQQQLYQRQLQRYRPIAVPPGQQLPELQVPGLNPGTYETQLPQGGMLRFRVPGGQLVPQNDRNRDAALAARVSDELAQAYSPLIAVLSAARSTGRRNLIDLAEDIEDKYDRMERQLERERLPQAANEWQQYSRLRQQLDRGLAEFQFGPRLRQQMTALTTREARIGRLFGNANGQPIGQPGRPVTPGQPIPGGPTGGPVYAPFDGPRVYGLANQWAESISRLEQGFAANARSWQTRSLQRQATRARLNAESLSASVIDGASYDHVVREFRQLDNAWAALLELSTDYGGFGPAINREARTVAAIDHQLHETLYVESPLVDNEQLIEPLLHDVARTASELDRELDRLANVSRRAPNYWRLRQAAGQLANQTASASRELAAGRPVYALRQRADEIEQTWRRVETEAERLRPDPEASYVVSLVDQMEIDLQRLARIAEGQFGWRYQITP